MNIPQMAGTPMLTEQGGSAVVRADRVVRRFGSGAATIVAVRGVTAAVAPRAQIALTGPSGSGKSTLLHLLAGLDTPTTGTVSWPGIDGHGTDGRAGIGVVFQGRSLVPNLDVTENVCLPLLFADCAEAEATARAADALDRLGIAELAHALPDELSGGQAQRVAIARVLAAAPRLILADEPTGQLDQDTAALVIDVLVHAADDLGAALIVSTHDPSIARRLPTEWAMHDGRLRAGARPNGSEVPR
jgi:ABC-type lipoprotein export system ATPase subunit